MASQDKFDPMTNVATRSQSDVGIAVGVKNNSRTQPGPFTNAQAPSTINPTAATKLRISMYLDSGQTQQHRPKGKKPGRG
ncbi:hypothetical protein [Pseudomonas gingeri]|uniref:hypothetical protein n=1 Tax=Pseudomonas gingeri TaxID=117681 RepID=UPI00210A88BF|nr:hypothetical protein [Pseudomonas gingeri]